jgi:hypothetical protein
MRTAKYQILIHSTKQLKGKMAGGTQRLADSREKERGGGGGDFQE